MQGMNVNVDARRKKLVAAGPVVAATAIRPEAADEEQLKRFAAKLIWWQPPAETLARPARFLMQVMTLGTWEDVKTVRQEYGEEAMRNALLNAEPGVFDRRSWAYWHAVFGLPPRPAPKRSLT
jgi:hypothetical protein